MTLLQRQLRRMAPHTSCVTGQQAIARRSARGIVHLLLAGALAINAVGCGGSKPTAEQTVQRYSQELRESVSHEVHDEARRTQMLSIVNQAQLLQQRFNQETVDFVASYHRLNADYDAERPAFEKLFADYNTKRVRARREALDLHFQLASLATTDEWRAIGKAEAKLYERTLESRQTEGGE
jgi:hypothetical protein